MRTARTTHPIASLVTLTAAALLVASTPRDAIACGCFANPTTVTQPAIQAGEKIVFSVDNGQVTMNVQIAYTGKSSEFGWLMPLPAVPTVEAGTDDLFRALEPLTTPTFSLTRQFVCRDSDTSACFAGAVARSAGGGFNSFDLGTVFEDNPLVIRDDVGPYEYAVLKADNKQAMIDWLAQNRFIVPVTSDAALVPYIHPGAYFLALKLKAGKETGDIQPIVVRYASDLPMIPITLTSIGAVDHMHILVWVLGNARAIPRNYHHTVLDPAAYDWVSGNYNDLLIRAVAEAPEHHTFVTEFSGPSVSFVDRLPIITLTERELEAKTDPVEFTQLLRQRIYPGTFGPAFNGVLRQILKAAIPEPDELIKQGVSSDDFYSAIDSYLQTFKQGGGMPAAFDAKATATEVIKRVVEPRNAANAMVARHPVLTRLHTALSPREMTADPVFSFNPDLPPVLAGHTATLENDCDTSYLQTDTTRTEWRNGSRPSDADLLPASLRIERLRESGAPEVVTDNAGRFDTNAGGCTVGDSARTRGRYLSLVLCALALLAVRLQSRRT